MKLSPLILFVTCSLFALSVQAELKAAYINSVLLLQKAPQALAATDALKKEFQSRDQALRELEQKVQSMAANLQRDAAIMSDDQKKKMEAEIRENLRKLQFDKKSLEEDVAQRRNQEIQKLRTTISGVIKQYAQDKGYDLVFTEGVAFAADKVDITDEILEQLSK
ncbi:MAG: OmpH family outer membrane protein [Gammaproteobacteria bacterium]|nr:OmpH family outer membrane protein [Gammaproteobacteria bacterium]